MQYIDGEDIRLNFGILMTEYCLVRKSCTAIRNDSFRQNACIFAQYNIACVTSNCTQRKSVHVQRKVDQ